MLVRHAAKLPKRFLKTLGECGEALTAADRLDVLPAAEGKPEMVEQMRERRTGIACTAAVGENRERLTALLAAEIAVLPLARIVVVRTAAASARAPPQIEGVLGAAARVRPCCSKQYTPDRVRSRQARRAAADTPGLSPFVIEYQVSSPLTGWRCPVVPRIR